MLSSSITKWLESNGSYEEGIYLLEQAQALKKSSKLKIIKSGKSSFSFSLLRQELSQILKSISKGTDAPAVPKKEKKFFGAIDTSRFPEDLIQLYDQTISNLKQIDQLKGLLRSYFYDESGACKNFPDERTAGNIARRIQTLFLENGENFSRLDYYREHGKYLPGTEPQEFNTARLKYLLSMQIKAHEYLSKARRKIARGEKYEVSTYNKYLQIEMEIKTILKNEQ